MYDMDEIDRRLCWLWGFCDGGPFIEENNKNEEQNKMIIEHLITGCDIPFDNNNKLVIKEEKFMNVVYSEMNRDEISNTDLSNIASYHIHLIGDELTGYMLNFKSKVKYRKCKCLKCKKEQE